MTCSPNQAGWTSEEGSSAGPGNRNERVLGGFVLDVCVVGASHERPGSYVTKAHGEAGIAEFIEIGRRVEPD